MSATRTNTKASALKYPAVCGSSAASWCRVVRIAVASRAELVDFRDDTVRLRDMVQSMIRQGSSRADIEAMLRNEFNFADFHVQGSLDGLIVELQ